MKKTPVLTDQSLRARIRLFAEAHDGREPGDLAKMFLRGCKLEDLIPLVEDAFKAVERTNVRFLEIEVLKANTPVRTTQTAASVRSRLGELAELLDSPYRIGDGNSARRFGALTVAEHRVRILMLHSQVNGLSRDIDLHEQAIAKCEEFGVSCLDEVEQAA